MKKKPCKTKDLDILLCLTDKAIFYAKRNDIVGVSRCLLNRKAVFEDSNVIQDASLQCPDYLKGYLEKLLKKDLVLKEILLTHREEIKRKKDNCSKSRKLRMRFSGKNPFMPKFIDRKI